MAAALLAVAACGGDDGGEAAPPDCETTFVNASEHSAAEYERGCTRDGQLVTFTRHECVDRPDSVLYDADFGSGRVDGVFFRDDYSSAGPDAGLKYCVDPPDIDPDTKTASDLGLSMCLAHATPAEARRRAQAAGLDDFLVDLVVSVVESCS